MGKKMKIRDNFGKLFTLQIRNKQLKYIPVIHITKYKKVRDYYVPEQTSRLISLKNTLNQF
jgi:hypothetical protein